MGEGSLIALVTAHADKFFSKLKLSEELIVDHIRKQFQLYGNESVAQFDKWHAKFGL